jgi:serine/threonine-protein kinase
MKRFLAFLAYLNRSPKLFAIAFWVLALFALAIATNWAIMPAIAGQSAKTMPVPNVVDLPADEAEVALHNAGLNVKWAKDGRYSGEIAANHVLLQMPGAGRTVKENRTILLTLSKGRQEVSVPELRGASQRQAEISLQRLELLLGSKIEGAHSEIPRGVVIRTEPEAGKRVRIGSKINIVISSGNSSGKILLPNLRNISLSRAQAVIDSLGFKVGNIITIQLADKLPNTVLELNPKPGEYLEEGTSVDLTVAE